MLSYTLWLVLSATSVVLADHFYSETFTFTGPDSEPEEPITVTPGPQPFRAGLEPQRPFRVRIRFRQTWDQCQNTNSWYCSGGNCGSEDRVKIETVEHGDGVSYSSEPWCQNEAVMTRSLQSNKPFEMRRSGCCWILNEISHTMPWNLLAHVDLGTRSDTGRPDSSPVTAILPFIRIPQNCPRTLNLLAHDPDGDQVRCRYAHNDLNECLACRQIAGFTLDENSCSIQYTSCRKGIYPFELVLEDFPMQRIDLSYNDGTAATKFPFHVRDKRHSSLPVAVAPMTTPAFRFPMNTAPMTRILPMPAVVSLSKIPLHFSIQVEPRAPSCTVGQFLPKFLEPTPENGEIRTVCVGQTLRITLKATATRARINNFIINGPQNTTKSITVRGKTGEAEISWTPNEDYLGEHVPICFIAESVVRSRIYHSELRCIIVKVTRLTVNAHVVCSESTMTVEVEKASVVGLHEDHLRLIDPFCTPISNSTHVIAAVSLSSCGTELKEDDENLIFSNKIVSFNNPNAVITREHEVEIDFSCCYPKKSKVSQEFRSHKLPCVFTEKGFGKFTYQFEFFQSNLFLQMVDAESYPIQVPLKEKLYMLINASSSLPNTELFVESCRATPVDDPNYHIYYDIFQNGCVVDDTVVVHEGNPTEFRFEMEAFQFIGQHEEVFICCTVILCKAGEPDSRCSQGCISDPTLSQLRVRRAVATETARHSISQGPLHRQKIADLTASNMGFNMNLAFIAVVLLLVAVIVCGAVIYVAKRPKAKYQPLPSTDFRN